MQKAREHIDLVARETDFYRSALKRMRESVQRLNLVVEQPVNPIPEIHFSLIMPRR